MENSKRKYFIVTLMILWIVALYLMIHNYHEYPPIDNFDPLSGRLNNMEASLYKYGMVSFAELIVGILWLYYFFPLPAFFRVVLILLSVGLLVWSYVDAMHSGGVVATHVLWFTVELGIIYFYIFFISIRNRKTIQ